MSQLPSVQNATLDDPKITDYLLNPAHPLGAGKWKFLTGFGFTAAKWAELKAALLDHPRRHPISGQSASPYGRKYEVSCSLQTPDNRNPCIVSVWIVEPHDPNPRFVTAYPNP